MPAQTEIRDLVTGDGEAVRFADAGCAAGHGYLTRFIGRASALRARRIAIRGPASRSGGGAEPGDEPIGLPARIASAPDGPAQACA